MPRKKSLYLVQLVLDEWRPSEHWAELTQEEVDDLTEWLEAHFDIGNIKDYHLTCPSSRSMERVLIMTPRGLHAELQRDLDVNQTVRDCSVEDERRVGSAK